MFKQIAEALDQSYDEMVQIRRYLHQYPELSFKETKTAQYIANFYEQLGLPYKTKVGGNGVIATLEGGKPGKVVALRADFDALPIQDEKKVPYQSKVDGVMHACGHDGHTATLLVLAKVMKNFQAEIPGTIVFVHQHAEEVTPGGAKPMIESGFLNHVDAFFGTHLWSTTPFGTIETAKKELMAGADHFEIIIQGKGGHAASPHETKDTVVIGAEIVTQLQQIVSRRIDPLETAVVTIGQFQAGRAFNVIADQATMYGTVRYFEQTVQEKIIAEMEKIIKGICHTYDATYTFNYTKGYPPLINHENEAMIILEAGKNIDEVKEVIEAPPIMGGEDFAYYLLEKPGAFFFTGARVDDEAYPHHHPKFDFNEKAMPIAAKTLAKIFLTYQHQKGN